MDKSFLENLGFWSELIKDLDSQMLARILEQIDPQTLSQALDGVLNMLGNNPDTLKSLLKNFLP